MKYIRNIKRNPNAEKLYSEMQSMSGIKVGDKVKVLRTARKDEMGWGNSWVSSRMDEMVGETFRVKHVGEDIALEDGNGNEWGFPFFVLEIVERASQLSKIQDFCKHLELLQDCEAPTEKSQRKLIRTFREAFPNLNVEIESYLEILD